MASGGGAVAIEHGGPERVWGELSSTYRVREAGGSPGRDTSLQNTTTISASSYIWRPWFASLNGSLSLSADETEAEGQPAAEDQFATGDARFDLFPGSRFPFSVYYIESRSQFENESFDRSLATTEYGLGQRYRSRDGMHSYRAEYDNRRQDDGGSSEFVSESLLLSGKDRVGRQSFDTDVNLDAVDNTITGDRAESYAITIDHAYGGATNFTLDNLVSTSAVERKLFAATDEIDTAQLTSFLSWHPRERKNLRLTGSLRLAETRIGRQTFGVAPADPVESETANANVNQGLIYEYSKNLQFAQSINSGFVDSDGNRVASTSESLSSRYTSDRVETGIGDYGWNASSAFRNLHGDVDPEQSLNSRVSHSLFNSSSGDGGYRLSTNLTQSLSHRYESANPDDKRIDHSFSITRSDAAAGNQNLLRLFVSESRSLNRDNDYFQLANLQYSATNRFGRYARLSGNLTLQLARQRFERERSEQTVGNGQLEYQHSFLFRVPGLMFRSRLQSSNRQSASERLFEDPEAETGLSWENSLRYRIGRLETQLDIDLVKVGDTYDRLFMFQLTRSFGDL